MGRTELIDIFPESGTGVLNPKSSRAWERLGQKSQPNWYLDPLVARAKKHEHMRLIERWLEGRTVSRILKTDLFEEAFGEDQLLFDLKADRGRYGVDLSFSAVHGAKARQPDSKLNCTMADLRALPFKARSFDLIVSTSSLDHFMSKPEFDAAIEQIVKVLAPGGILIVTLDNLYNPLYFPLKWLSRFRWAPYPLGYTPSLGKLRKILTSNGMSVLDTGCLIHNPRLISTALFLLLRRITGNRSSYIIEKTLKAFSLMDALPTRYISACFVAVHARKTVSSRNLSL